MGVWALLLAGCAPPCTTFEDMALTNPDGNAREEVVDTVRAAIDEFVGWSARDGVCVDEVRLVEEIEDPDVNPAGRYTGDLIQVEYTSNPYRLPYVVAHELCHAADYEGGLFSETRPGWFGTEDAQERFAELCESGPRSATWLEAVEVVCGENLGGARQEWINDVVYGAADLPRDAPGGPVDVALERVVVRRVKQSVAWEPYGGGIAVYLEAPRVDRKGYLYADLFQVRPDGSVHRVYGPRLDSDAAPALFASDAGPLLVFAGRTGAWRVDEAAGVVVEVPFPAVEQVGEGVVLGDTAWFLGVVEGDGPMGVWRVDLATGEPSAVGWPEGVASWIARPYGDALAGWSQHDGESEAVWLSYTPATNRWDRAPAPVELRSGERLTLPDGRVFATWAAFSDGRFDGLAVFDPGTGEWSIADSPCDEDAIGLDASLVSIGGEPYLWEYPNPWSTGVDGDYHVLTRVVVGK